MTRDDLKNYRYTKEWVEDQLEEYENRIQKVMNLGQSLSGMPKAQNKPNYELEKIIDEYKDILKLVHQEQRKMSEIVKQLNLLKPLYKSILYKRYIEGKKLEQISTEVNYSYNRTCAYNGYALNEFDKLDNSVKNDKIC